MSFPRRLLPLLLVCAAVAHAAAPADAMKVLKTNCFSCHNEEKQKGGLVMTTRAGLLKGGENGAAFTEGEPEKSEMIASLEAGADPHMPPKKQLAPAQIDLLKQWIKDGAKWDAATLAAVEAPAAPRKVSLEALPGTYHPVLALALSPDGKRLAAGCANRLLLYEVADTKLTLSKEATGHPDPIQSITWSADGQRLATGAFRRVVLWKTETLEKEREITAGLTDRITALRFLPDGKLLMADGQTAQSGIVRIADAATGAIAASWNAHTDTIFDLALSPDAKQLATAGADKLIKVWDLSTQKEVAKLEGHTSQVLGVAFNKDGKLLVSGGADQQLKVWDVQTKEKIVALGTYSTAITAVAWVAGGPTIFAGTNTGGLAAYTELKTHTGEQRSDSAKERKLDGCDDAIYCLAVAPNAERVFGGTPDGRILAWNKNGKIVATVQANEFKPTAANP
jgi:WD40 repeat protein/mono/diheme cytochrome c family protein